jgi:starch synthase
VEESLNILMVAAENDALAGAKVGGVGDVVRDVPYALVDLPEYKGAVSVVCPSYGYLHKAATASLGVVKFSFAGEQLTAELFEVPGKRPANGVRQLVLHHEAFETVDAASGRQLIYVDDAADTPFENDATKFACFNAAIARGILQGLFGQVDVVHLHDWHAGFYLLLREFDPSLSDLRSKRTVFTIHNLALQGIRPLRGYDSSLESWFPELAYEPAIVCDPEYLDCLNPMAVGVRLADKVHVVSPGYVSEVCQPSRPQRNDPQCIFFGGEGLEGDLQNARDEGRLIGILNGCEYATSLPSLPTRDQDSWQNLLSGLIAEVSQWYQRSQTFPHWLTLRRLTDWLESARPRPVVVMTSVTRVVDQKVRLMRTPEDSPPLDRILDELSDDVVYLLAGNGDAGYEYFLHDLARRHSNFVFLNGYSQRGADMLYATGDLFLMPSAFEPCGISQMLAMRDGQPCVVHSIGGLKDTVRDGETGFAFTGSSQDELGDGFVEATRRAVDLKRRSDFEFQKIRSAAFTARFLWSDSVRRYLSELYAN